MARARFAEVAAALTGVRRRFYTRGWVLGASGNFSAVIARDPLRLALTASSVHKGLLSPEDILQCDDRGAVVANGVSNGRARAHSSRTSTRDALPARPSAETLLHLEIARRRGAAA